MVLCGKIMSQPERRSSRPVFSKTKRCWVWLILKRETTVNPGSSDTPLNNKEMCLTCVSLLFIMVKLISLTPCKQGKDLESRKLFCEVLTQHKP